MQTSCVPRQAAKTQDPGRDATTMGFWHRGGAPGHAWQGERAKARQWLPQMPPKRRRACIAQFACVLVWVCWHVRRGGGDESRQSDRPLSASPPDAPPIDELRRRCRHAYGHTLDSGPAWASHRQRRGLSGCPDMTCGSENLCNDRRVTPLREDTVRKPTKLGRSPT